MKKLQIIAQCETETEAREKLIKSLTKKQLLLLDSDISDFEGYNWTKKEGVNYILMRYEYITLAEIIKLLNK